MDIANWRWMVDLVGLKPDPPARLSGIELPLIFSSAWGVRPRFEGRTDETEAIYGEQIIAVLREHEAGAKAGDLARKHGVSEASFQHLELSE